MLAALDNVENSKYGKRYDNIKIRKVQGEQSQPPTRRQTRSISLKGR